MSVYVNSDIMKTNKENVLFVTTNVPIVPDLVSTVYIVLKTESMPQLVSVQKDTMITVPHYVQLVTKNVLLVKTCQTTVPFVLPEELTHLNVISQNQVLNPLKLKTFHKPLLES
jgi:hypothetical protein